MLSKCNISNSQDKEAKAYLSFLDCLLGHQIFEILNMLQIF